MTDFQRRAWVTVDLDNLNYNIEQIRGIVRPETMIMGVVKADAYGHGDCEVARALQEQGIISWFGVSRLEEALALRDYGITLPILIFGITPATYAKILVEYDLVPTVHTLDYAKELNDALVALGATRPIHLKLDTGMSRMGLLAYGEALPQTVEDIETIYHLPALIPQGLYTHFAVSDCYDPPSAEFTKLQYERYSSTRSLLDEQGLTFPIYHVCNSAAILSYPEMQLDMVRAGIIIYGLHPSTETTQKLNLRPVMSFYGEVAMVKEIPAGATVSYGREFTAAEPTRIANVGIGYADGYDRTFSNRGSMLVHGKRAPIRGRVCMDQLMLDITHIPGVKRGDLVTVVGTNGEESIGFEELANMTGTIHYEKTSGITKRVPRVYLRGGEPVGVRDLLRGHSRGFEEKALK